jgi:tRNA (guanine-N7-)-methyltransferase
MHGMHARLPKNFVLEERLERYRDAIELCPARYAGAWAQACTPLDARASHPFTRVHVDLGCGKGAFVVESARRHPQTLYVAIDAEPICIAYTAQRVSEARLRNVVVVPARGDQLPELFAKGEVDAITLNFPTPYPRKKDAAHRLTILDNLLGYRRVLAPEGTVLLKTDSYPLWRFSQTQLEEAGYRLRWSSRDARSERPDDVTSEYEERLARQGACVYALEATPGPLPAEVRQSASLSLVDYLPHDLEGLDYVPHGMQGTVVNLRNQRRHRERERRAR